MKKVTLSSLGLIALLAASTAYATEHTPPTAPQDSAHHGGERFAETDSDNDGTISKDEWRAKGDKMFGNVDANNDGKLTKEEMKAHHEKKRAEWKERREDRKEKMGEMREKMKERKELKGAPTTEPVKQ